jgi:asparagine N-glycosylation enzyme membrane subunit Stt3
MEVLNLPFGVVVYYDYAVALIATAAMALVAFFVRQSYRAAIDEVLHDIYIFFPVIVFAVIQGLRLGTASQAEFYAARDSLRRHTRAQAGHGLTGGVLRRP